MVRIKERYLLVDILYPDTLKDATENQPDLVCLRRPTTNDLSPRAIVKEVQAQVNVLFGDYGSGLVERGLQVKYLSTATSTFILRVHREHLRLVWAALTFMDHIPIKNGRPCVYSVVHVSGTMRKVEIAAIQRSRALLLAIEKQVAGRESDVLDTLFGRSGGAGSGSAGGSSITDQIRRVVADDDDSGDGDSAGVSVGDG